MKKSMDSSSFLGVILTSSLVVMGGAGCGAKSSAVAPVSTYFAAHASGSESGSSASRIALKMRDSARVARVGSSLSSRASSIKSLQFNIQSISLVKKLSVTSTGVLGESGVTDIYGSKDSTSTTMSISDALSGRFSDRWIDLASPASIDQFLRSSKKLIPVGTYEGISMITDLPVRLNASFTTTEVSSSGVTTIKTLKTCANDRDSEIKKAEGTTMNSAEYLVSAS